jgi:hypothetical protein
VRINVVPKTVTEPPKKIYKGYTDKEGRQVTIQQPEIRIPTHTRIHPSAKFIKKIEVMKHDDRRSTPSAKEKSANTHKTNTLPYKEKTLEAPVEDTSNIIDIDDDNESLPDVL